MSRLTAHKYEVDLFKSIYCKLEMLEDIEEELGIELVTLFKALTNGIYTKKGYSPAEKIQIYFGNHPTFIFSECDNDGYILSNYGETWALTREELEDEKTKM